MKLSKTLRTGQYRSEKEQKDYIDRYFRRLKSSRRKYIFEKIKRTESGSYGMSEIWLWFKMDVKYVLLSVSEFYKKWVTTKEVIRSAYGLSGISQFFRMMYVVLVQRNISKHFYTRLLFKNENWKKRSEFAYRICIVQYDLMRESFPAERDLIEDKFLFYKYCKPLGLKIPDVLAEGSGQHFELMPGITPQDLLRDLFIKIRKGGQGSECMILRYENECFESKRTGLFKPTALAKILQQTYSGIGYFIVQPRLSNHESWQKWTPGGLATCRIVSARDPENEKRIIPLFGALRMPLQGFDVDNYSQGGVIVPISMQDGLLGRGVTLKPVNGKFEFSRHPDTGAQIEGVTLPYWNTLVNQAIETHTHFKTCFVGWDLTMTSEGVMMIEGNIGWASGSYEIPWQDSIRNTDYPWLHERWCEKFGI